MDELSILYSSVVLSLPPSHYRTALVTDAQADQMFFFTRVLAGKLHEAWLWLRGNLPKGSPEELHLSRRAKAALRSIRRTFVDHRAVFYEFRNSASFHVNEGNCIRAFHRLPDTEALRIWKTGRFGSTRNNLSWVTYASMSASLTRIGWGPEAFESFQKLVAKTGSRFIVLLTEWAMSTIRDHVRWESSSVEVPDVRDAYLAAFYLSEGTAAGLAKHDVLVEAHSPTCRP